MSFKRCTEVRGLDEPDDALIQARIEAIRKLKLERGVEPLADADIDQVVGPVDCRRTRRRLAGLPADGGGARPARRGGRCA